MAKECIIYYGEVVESDSKEHWAKKGLLIAEPRFQEWEGPIGKDPEYCCADFEKAYKRPVFSTQPGNGRLSLLIRDAVEFTAPVSFCPYCGARVVFKKDLNLRAVNKVRTLDHYIFEAI